MQRLISFLLIFSLAATTAQAATYYTSPSGSGSTCSTGSRCSFATGLAKLVAGDTLIVGDGNYTAGFRDPISGTSFANMTVIKAENDGQAVFTATSAVDGLAVILRFNDRHVGK